MHQRARRLRLGEAIATFTGRDSDLSGRRNYHRLLDQPFVWFLVMKHVSAFLCGLMFALGLGLGEMTQPARIIGFLNVAGRWDPTLIFVMGGAIAASVTLFPLILKRTQPILAGSFVLPEKRHIDLPLIAGAVLFGVGWGLSGYCPGPALVSLVTLRSGVLVFVISMAAGLYVGKPLLKIQKSKISPAAAQVGAPSSHPF